jgi:hypothetical protein
MTTGRCWLAQLNGTQALPNLSGIILPWRNPTDIWLREIMVPLGCNLYLHFIEARKANAEIELGIALRPSKSQPLTPQLKYSVERNVNSCVRGIRNLERYHLDINKSEMPQSFKQGYVTLQG